MKLTHIFAVVFMLHLAVVSALFVFPGCQEVKDVGQNVRPQGDRADPNTPFGEPPSHAEGPTVPAQGYAAPEASPESSPQLLPPTRPSWNIASTSEPEVIEGEVYEETTEFNAINPELGESETVVLKKTVVSTLQTEKTYTVKKGDNLTKIAKSQGVSLADLMAANGLNKKSIIQIGQTLIIPSDSLAGPAAPSAPVISSSDISQEGTPYEVQRGDTLGGIAKRYGTTVAAIRGVNGLSGNTIYAGQTLVIPSDGATVPAPPPVKPAKVTAASGETAYVVASGDYLGDISDRFGVGIIKLAERNNIEDPSKLRAGQTLIIPAGYVDLGSSRGASGTTATPSTTSANTTAPVAPKPKSQTSVAPVPAPAQPVIVEETTVEEIDLYENIDDIPVAPVQVVE